MFSQFFKENKLSEYKIRRRPVIIDTLHITRILTEMMQGKTTKAKIFRFLAPILMPLIFPLIRKKITNFMLGIDHQI